LTDRNPVATEGEGGVARGLPQPSPAARAGATGAEAMSDARRDELLDRLMTAMEKLLELKITTRLRDPDGANHVEAVSKIDILQADISNEFPKDFFAEEQSGFRNFHAGQVTLARSMMESNLKLLGETIERLRKAI
jgi:hypothetical protein